MRLFASDYSCNPLPGINQLLPHSWDDNPIYGMITYDKPTYMVSYDCEGR